MKIVDGIERTATVSVLEKENRQVRCPLSFSSLVPKVPKSIKSKNIHAYEGTNQNK
jgi:hypothetical protein